MVMSTVASSCRTRTCQAETTQKPTTAGQVESCQADESGAGRFEERTKGHRYSGPSSSQLSATAIGAGSCRWYLLHLERNVL